MKIAIIGTAYPYRGGLANFNERLTKEFLHQGHQVTIYTFTVQYPNFLFPGKSQYSEDPPPTDLTIDRCIHSMNPLNWYQVGKKIKNTQPDLVIVNYWLPFMGPCFGTILRQIKKGCAATLVSLTHNIIPHESRIGDEAFTNYYVKPVDAYLAMSRAVLQKINEFDPTTTKVYSPHPIYDNFGARSGREEALAKLGYDPACQYILFFGLIREYKGLDLLIKAFADPKFRNHKIKVIIAGEYYADRAPYHKLIKDAGLTDEIIEVDRFIKDSEVADYFNACDLVVQPYKSATQSGVTQIAYHFNKPMVVTNVGGLPEMCPDGKVGYVVAPKPEEIATAIFRFFFDTDRKAMIRHIKEEKKKYSWEILTKNILALSREQDPIEKV